MKSCFKDAAKGSKTASGLACCVELAELIKWNGTICDPAMKLASAIGIYAVTIV